MAACSNSTFSMTDTEKMPIATMTNELIKQNALKIKKNHIMIRKFCLLEKN